MVNGNDKGSATDFPSDEGSRFSVSPWLLIHSCRETTPRKTVEHNRLETLVERGGRDLLTKRRTDFIKWQYSRRRRRRQGSFTFSSFFVPDFRFHSAQLNPSLLPLAVMRNHAFRFCYAERRYALYVSSSSFFGKRNLPIFGSNSLFH